MDCSREARLEKAVYLLLSWLLKGGEGRRRWNDVQFWEDEGRKWRKKNSRVFTFRIFNFSIIIRTTVPATNGCWWVRCETLKECEIRSPATSFSTEGTLVLEITKHHICHCFNEAHGRRLIFIWLIGNLMQLFQLKLIRWYPNRNMFSIGSMGPLCVNGTRQADN